VQTCRAAIVDLRESHPANDQFDVNYAQFDTKALTNCGENLANTHDGGNKPLLRGAP